MPVDPNALATWANAITVRRICCRLAGHVPGRSPITTRGRGSRSCCGSCSVSATESTATSPGGRERPHLVRSSTRSPTRCWCWVRCSRWWRVTCSGWLPVALIAGREVIISVYRTFVASKGVSVPASQLGQVEDRVPAVRRRLRAVAVVRHGREWLWLVAALDRRRCRRRQRCSVPVVLARDASERWPRRRR